MEKKVLLFAMLASVLVVSLAAAPASVAWWKKAIRRRASARQAVDHGGTGKNEPSNLNCCSCSLSITATPNPDPRKLTFKDPLDRPSLQRIIAHFA
jgi:hypothetical protein